MHHNNIHIKPHWIDAERAHANILDKLTTEAAVKIRSFGNTQRIHFSDDYVSLMGSNGAAHTLTNWDGSQVTGLGTVKKKQGGMSM